MAGVWLSWAADAARAAVRGTSYRVVEVAGWQTRGHGGYRVVEGIVGHHTGTPATASGDFPSLAIVRDGRSDLTGPLCTYGLGRSGTIYVVAAGVAWHAGASAYAGFVDLNDEFAGVEAESAGAGGWTDEQLDCYPRLIAAFLAYIRRDVSRYCSHRTCALPVGRKPDPKGIDDEWMAARSAFWLSRSSLVRPSPVKLAPPVLSASSLPTLRYGDRSGAVLNLQKFMTRVFASYNSYTPTGFYGDSTRAGIREFQSRASVTGFPLDGSVVGPATNAMLWEHGFRG